MDRAALDAALESGIPCGGWCPRGRLAEDGAIPDRYPLTETPSADYAVRTDWNVRDSDGTLVLTSSPPTGGTALTIELARRRQKPYRVVDPADWETVADVRRWLHQHRIEVLNVAGPRESVQPGIYRTAREYLRRLLADESDPEGTANLR